MNTISFAFLGERIRIYEEKGIIQHISFLSQSNQEDDPSPFLVHVKELFLMYARGDIQILDVPIEYHGTPFQHQVWKTLLEVPYGETISYKELAIRSGYPKACRAVGSAMHNNPIPIIIPCHRVIPISGGYGQYGGGRSFKVDILNLEEKHRSIQ